MNRLVVMTRPDQVNGYRLAGLEAFGIDDPETIHRVITSWLMKKEQILLALGDSLFSVLGEDLIKKIYSSDDMLLVTIPDGPVSAAEKPRQHRIFDTIRHATGVQIRFRGEVDGTNA